jgi:hypothetical protein
MFRVFKKRLRFEASIGFIVWQRYCEEWLCLDQWDAPRLDALIQPAPSEQSYSYTKFTLKWEMIQINSNDGKGDESEMKGVHSEWKVAEVAVLQDLLILLYLQSFLLSVTGCCPILLVSLCILVASKLISHRHPAGPTGDLWVLLHSVYCGLLIDYLLFIYCLFLVLLLAACFSAFFCQSVVYFFRL